MKKGIEKESAGDVGFVSVKIRLSTFAKLKAHKKKTRIPMAAFIDKAVENEFSRTRK
jgi:hypothetical protein